MEPFLCPLVGADLLVEETGERNRSHLYSLIPGHVDSGYGRDSCKHILQPLRHLCPFRTNGAGTESSMGHTKSVYPAASATVKDVKPVDHRVISPLPHFICCEMSFSIKSNMWNTMLVNKAFH